ncbi:MULTISPECIES: PD-(D/E)XK nuclease family protein [unclassified Campylobacter]|uniref:PD-(D/E)XK nuclease family protein n=1 Tax=unclassified Campylobacter TaxID=2593542 RepID=UPI0022E9D77F|nr:MULTISPECIES: PD-(D/E)XK nuclease family protein [unclassified Campylobacter]MDA3043136.1 PD-(D/E)XK nuclease family protein [Campylobacter sp. JMF_09 ED2]MDA3044826.1 PD-(D/E)XK nuclease family protein [Campylobacter sp. JMF_07 ED4]MDA3063862.1 PD-(D/E)XK nuclease family protein [Campylobacter sp. JMF_11 EL3]MDA3072089.1 PD-(D/E)XK nuclease family protein [Campylobacter sp. VBCF_03 NA9]MDA3075108.1 PD-(D/E)XK nuclease family protein [Campylobacter sp. JMF_05 ED3]
MNSTQPKQLRVFTTYRSLKEAVNRAEGGIVFAESLSEFYKKAVFVNGFDECGQIERTLFMQEAVKNTKNANEKLRFPSEFFEFMQHKDYLFKFFKELASEKVSLQTLDFSDTYAQYSEHFEILKELLQNYQNFLQNAKSYDEITLPQIYELNENYLKRFDSIEIDIDGNPSKFEFEILKRASQVTQIYLNFKASKFNQKTLRSISELCGLNFESGFSYKLNLSENKILESYTAPIPQNSEIVLKGFELRALQACYIFEKISKFISLGINPEKIAVILPDEKFAKTLKALDEKINKNAPMLNFAMGESVRDSLFGVSLAKISECIKENIRPNFNPQYLNLGKDTPRDLPNEYDLFFKEAGISEEIFDKFRENFNKSVEFEVFDACINELLRAVKTKNDALANKLKSPKFLIKILNEKFGENLTLSNLIDLFLGELKNVKLDDINGGKVTVMGLLESRGASFEAVIIPDFNDDFVPKRSEGEMFLNSTLRAKAGLISHKDREDLQRFYYSCLIFGAKKVAICYHDMAEKSPSRFLKNFNTQEDMDEFSMQDYLRIFNGKIYEKPEFSDFTPKMEHDFFAEPVSHARFDTFSTCKRKYYYSYILNIKEGLKFGEDNASMGNILHEAFEEYYAKYPKFDYAKFVEIYLKKAMKKNVDFYSIYYDLCRVKFLAKTIVEHEQKWNFAQSEANFDGVKFNEFATISGKIDRIDTNESGDRFIIDYKRGDYNAKSMQLKFYKALLGDDEMEAAYLSLRDKKFAFDENEKDDAGKSAFEILSEKFEEIRALCESEISFERASKSGACKYCAYKIICKGEIND